MRTKNNLGEWVRYKSMDEDYKISLEEFLFGGDHSLDLYHNPRILKSFDNFKEEVEAVLDHYCWDTNLQTTVEISEANGGCQVFEVPEDKVLLDWYSEIKEKYKKGNEE